MLTIGQIKEILSRDDAAQRDQNLQQQYQDAVAANPGRAIHRHHVIGTSDETQPNRNGRIYPVNRVAPYFSGVDVGHEAGSITRRTLNEAFRAINQPNYNWREHHNIPANFNREILDELFANFDNSTPFTDEVKDQVLERAEDVDWVKEGF